MSERLTDEAIARALNLTEEAVKDIREGDADIEEIENPAVKQNQPPAVIINTKKPTFRQKVISVWRAKGGVGCSAVAMNLARQVADSVDSVALIDLNFQVGPPDLTYYMDLPAAPTMYNFKQGDGIESFYRKENNLFVLQAPHNKYQLEKTTETVNEVCAFSRKVFDAVIFDLPNTEDDYVREAIEHSNTVVMAVEGTSAEMIRLEIKAKNFKNKDKIVLLKNDDDTGRVKEVLETHKVIKIPNDKHLGEALENQAFARRNSPFNKMISQLKDEIYEYKSSGLLNKIGFSKLRQSR
ncbi:MAG: AAA family ATPase [Clostridiales bacterium]|nr:AAA family ATPase [Clostridiales bacterium]MCF8022677.1 AAA family ATPase [Clostridiales bacterium]